MLLIISGTVSETELVPALERPSLTGSRLADEIRPRSSLFLICFLRGQRVESKKSVQRLCLILLAESGSACDSRIGQGSHVASVSLVRV
ncbi:MAG: hypothetical protein CME32_19685 [Gimesia sp.]|nr:hypothetical protein [Gimesia sp.]